MELLDIPFRPIKSLATSEILCHLPAHREESVNKMCQHTEARSEDGLWRFGCGEVLPDGGSNGGCKAGGRALPDSLWSRCHPFSAPFPMTGESTGLFDLLELTSETTQIVWPDGQLEPFPSKQRLRFTNPDLGGLKLPHKTSS